MQIIRLKFDTEPEAIMAIESMVGNPDCTVVRVYPSENTGVPDEFGAMLLSPAPGIHYDILARDEVDMSGLSTWQIFPGTPQHSYLGVEE